MGRGCLGGDGGKARTDGTKTWGAGGPVLVRSLLVAGSRDPTRVGTSLALSSGKGTPGLETRTKLLGPPFPPCHLSLLSSFSPIPDSLSPCWGRRQTWPQAAQGHILSAPLRTPFFQQPHVNPRGRPSRGLLPTQGQSLWPGGWALCLPGLDLLCSLRPRGWGPGIVPPTGRRGEEISLRKEAFFWHLETRGRVSGWTTAIENDCRHGEEVYGGI